jgi:hypothetical protein
MKFLIDVRPTRPTTHRLPGVISPGINRSGREADRSPVCSAEVKKYLLLHSLVNLHVLQMEKCT